MIHPSLKSDDRPMSDPSAIRVLAVVGPTAVGKTALAEELAVLSGGEIVSADSMQVYRGMDIGTSKPPQADRRVPYWCLDVAEPGKAFSAACYQRVAREAIADIASRGCVPTICGGTGLYVRAALDDLKFPPPAAGADLARKHYESLTRAEGPDAVYAVLAQRDPVSAALVHPNNTRRVIRALEMLDNGVSYADQQSGFSHRESIYDTRFVGLTMERAMLYERIDARVDGMLDAGLLDEVRRLLDAGLGGALTAGQAIGYKEFVPVVEGRADLEQAVVAVKKASRRYAKRQLTWFRADARIRWIDVTGFSLAQSAEAALGTLDW